MRLKNDFKIFQESPPPVHVILKIGTKQTAVLKYGSLVGCTVLHCCQIGSNLSSIIN